ncbi:hypothetical protein ACER0A_005345 [Haloimpatiens sp. FM7315]|uniref:hypothetical protein n=1 Tax=Haloimpatiens sp. FM7315 TaxID=3298609 RepID=UPI0035A3C9D7
MQFKKTGEVNFFTTILNRITMITQATYANLAFDPAEALTVFRLNSFTKKYIKDILARVTGYIEEQTGVASNYCNYMNTQSKNPFEIEHIITDHYDKLQMHNTKGISTIQMKMLICLFKLYKM